MVSWGGQPNTQPWCTDQILPSHASNPSQVCACVVPTWPDLSLGQLKPLSQAHAPGQVFGSDALPLSQTGLAMLPNHALGT